MAEQNTNTPSSLIVFHHSEMAKIERDEEQANEALKAVRKRKRNYRKTIQADGLKLKNFDRAREYLLAEEDEVREDLAEVGRILVAFKAPIAHQFDLFEEPVLDTLEERWRYQGFLVGARGGNIEECPHREGDNGRKAWMDGYKGAQASIAMGMEQSESVETSYADDQEVENKDIESAAEEVVADEFETEDDALDVS